MNAPRFTFLETAFAGMGTQLALRVWVQPGSERAARRALARERAFLRRAEALLSRFRPDSEISRLNDAAGKPVRVSPLTLAAIQAARDAAAATGGLFDPTIRNALLAAGYDRDFAAIGRGSAVRLPLPPQAGRWREIAIDPSRRLVRLPAGVGIDLGGIAKGWLADRVAERLSRFGPALADLGGDLALRGLPPDGDPWRFDVEDPRGGVLGTVRLHSGGIATSGTTRRRWQDGAAHAAHHIIDPRTGMPALTDLLAVTVVAPDAATAEVAAKGTLLLGSTLGAAALNSAGLAGILVRQEGKTTVVGAIDWLDMHDRVA
jgi:thiamine biosynthesis lipoprotein